MASKGEAYSNAVYDMAFEIEAAAGSIIVTRTATGHNGVLAAPELLPIFVKFRGEKVRCGKCAMSLFY